ncbi:MAG: PDZ domain-containing protein [Sedimentisphaerales bacterium]|nr:PDZ domain-containing protein [Sedimentisphaerales bacterium]
MNKKAITVLVLLLWQAVVWGDGAADANTVGSSLSDGRQAFVGVQLGPVPELLNKHLQLQPGGAILIHNILVGSPADDAGLEKDDIIVALNEEPISNYSLFVADIQRIGAGHEITLDIIHNGERERVALTLAGVSEATANLRWRHNTGPIETAAPRTFRMQPGSGHWQEVPPVTSNIEEMTNWLANRHNMIHRNQNWTLHSVTVIVNGDPDDNDTPIIIHTDQGTQRTTIGQIDDLPEDLREPVRDAIETSRYSSFRGGQFHFRVPGPIVPDGAVLQIPQVEGEGDSATTAEQERLQERLERLQERIEALESQATADRESGNSKN